MSHDEDHLQIGVVADRTDLSIRTLRHYDEAGLVKPSARSAGGFRLYTEADIDRLTTIRRMKPLGFTLAEMKQLLDSLDMVSDSAAIDNGYVTTAADFISDCHARALEQCHQLRRQLAYAEELTDLLATKGTPPK